MHKKYLREINSLLDYLKTRDNSIYEQTEDELANIRHGLRLHKAQFKGQHRLEKTVMINGKRYKV